MNSRVLKSVLTPIVFGILVVVIWQVVVDGTHAPAYILPSPSRILSAAWHGRSLLLSAAKVTGINALAGLVVGATAALVVAMIANQLGLLDSVLGSLAAGASAIPIVAMAPLFYAMFSDTAEYPRQLTVAVFVFFPVYVNVGRGLRQVSGLHHDLMRTLAASRWQTIRHLQLPSATPFLFSGLRIAAPSAVITSLVSEYFGGPQNGLGQLITTAAQSSSFDEAWGFVLGSILLGLIAFGLSSSLELAVEHRLQVAG